MAASWSGCLPSQHLVNLVGQMGLKAWGQFCIDLTFAYECNMAGDVGCPAEALNLHKHVGISL